MHLLRPFSVYVDVASKPIVEERIFLFNMVCEAAWFSSVGSRANARNSTSDAPFDAYFDERTVEALWNQRQRRHSAADHQSSPTTIHSEQPPVNTTPSVETSPTPADAVLDTAGPRTHPLPQESEHVEYPSLPVASASQDPPSLRRVVVQRKINCLLFIGKHEAIYTMGRSS